MIHYVVKMALLVKIMGSRLDNSVVAWFRAVAARTGAYTVAKVEHVSSRTSSGATYDLAIELAPAVGGRAIRLVIEAQERVSAVAGDRHSAADGGIVAKRSADSLHPRNLRAGRGALPGSRGQLS